MTANLAMSVDEFHATEAMNSRKGTDAFVFNIATLLQIKPGQIKVACVHKPGQPCLIDTRRRREKANVSAATVTAPRAAAGNNTAASTALALRNEKMTVVEFEIGAPGTFKTENEVRAYLAELTGAILDDISSGELYAEMEKQGYPQPVVTVHYDYYSYVNSTTTTTYTTTTTTNGTMASEAEGMDTGVLVGLIAAALVILAVIIVLVVIKSKRAQLDHGEAKAVTVNAGYEAPATWQSEGGTLKKVKGSVYDGFDPRKEQEAEESYFSRRSRAELAQDSLFRKRPDESSTDANLAGHVQVIRPRTPACTCVRMHISYTRTCPGVPYLPYHIPHTLHLLYRARVCLRTASICQPARPHSSPMPCAGYARRLPNKMCLWFVSTWLFAAKHRHANIQQWPAIPHRSGHREIQHVNSRLPTPDSTGCCVGRWTTSCRVYAFPPI